MAKLSERVYGVEHYPCEVKISPPQGYVIEAPKGYSYESLKNAGWSDQEMISYGYLVLDTDNTNTLIKQENTTMATNTLRTLNLTLLDLSPELKGEDKVVYEKANVRTEYTDEQTIQNLLATGDVLSALKSHNEKVRTKTLDAQYKGSAREVFLEEIDHLGDSRLKWEVIRVG